MSHSGELQIIQSFEPVVDGNSNVLVLGSMPGQASLDFSQYYANPRNTFWRIISELTGNILPSDYDERLAMLKANRIAVWDVVHSCVRPGSLDTSIDKTSLAPNDFRDLLSRYPGIEQIFFNGSFAESAYRKYVISTLTAAQRDIPTQRLPSTSPAHAGMAFDKKLDAWRKILPGPKI